MKSLEFTDNELRTLVWALGNEYAKYSLLAFEQGRSTQECETLQRLLALSDKAYYALTH